MTDSAKSITVAIAWCLAWGDKRKPQFDLSVLQQMRQALNEGKEVPEEVRLLVEQVKRSQDIPRDYFPGTLEKLKDDYPDLWEQKTQIGLVYGGATKIKQYVFEAAKLPDIRGASGLLDRINLIDLPAFFSGEDDSNFPQCQQAREYCRENVREKWLDKTENFPELSKALIPELIVYSTGGNILAFCPAAFVNDLANATEKRYTEETLTANSCAVGEKFKLLEIRFGVLRDPIENTPWLDWYRKNNENPLVRAYYGYPKNDQEIEETFKNRKSFNELAGKLASSFNQRRNGNNMGDNRPLRRYPPMFETHPYLRRDAGDRRLAIFQAELPGNPWFSEALVRKRLVSELAKQENRRELPEWYTQSKLEWEPGADAVESWVGKFDQFLDEPENISKKQQYYEKFKSDPSKKQKIVDETRSVREIVEEAKSVREISNASKPNGFVAYIYADGNNMGGYIQKIKTPEEYKDFSKDIFDATEKSVYEAFVKHLRPHKLKNLTDPDNKNRNDRWIHPFEIITIGGDDVMLIVPADQALAITQTIGEEFEKRLLKPEQQHRYTANESYNPKLVHRYQSQNHEKQPSGSNQCKLSMSIGVLITAENTPIYYAEDLTNQLLKSAKKRSKDLKKDGYYGGTVDFLVMKSVTMISSNINEFRSQALTKYGLRNQKLKLYAAPYTLHELGGLLDTAKALKESGFPRSQLYQIRSLLENGKQTAILNYRYFRVRLKQGQTELKEQFEDAWCEALTNDGNLAPWMSDISVILNNLMLLLFFETFPPKQFLYQYVVLSLLKTSNYETIWRELVDLYPFTEQVEEEPNNQQATTTGDSNQ
ncbi:MAG: type III-B CRISPR-associated protein Cas10/Cmr2 [Coleofasciculaceae cyanobacterium]